MNPQNTAPLNVPMDPQALPEGEGHDEPWEAQNMIYPPEE